jgi:hypothetical protein
MAEKVARTGIKRDNNYLYYLKGGAVWRVGRKKPGAPKSRPEKVADAGVTMEEGYMYFVDRDGDVARTRRAVGGQKRKAAKKAVKKVTKKAPKKAKKAAKKGKRR